MKVKDLKEYLNTMNIPDDTEFELGKFIVSSEDKERIYDVRLDLPIIGMGYNPEDKELVMVVDDCESLGRDYLSKFGVINFEGNNDIKKSDEEDL